MLFKFGRAPRETDKRIPHLRDLEKTSPLPKLPSAVQHSKGMTRAFGMMQNKDLNDCTCAAYYHARQVWTFCASGAEITEADANVKRLYSEVSGYKEGMKNGGPAVSVQHVLKHLVTDGAPIGEGGRARDHILGFVELDFTSVDHVKRAVFECGVAYLGIVLPKHMFLADGTAKDRWEYDARAPSTGDAHAVVVCDYDEGGATAISWGQKFTLTWPFITHYTDEAYALADKGWVTARKTTPAGMTVEDLVAQMMVFRRTEPRHA